MQKNNFYIPLDSSKLFFNLIVYTFFLQIGLTLIYSILASILGYSITDFSKLDAIKYINTFIVEIFFVIIYFCYIKVHKIAFVQANALHRPLSWQNVAIILVLMGFIYVLSSPFCAVFESFLDFIGYNLNSLNIKLDNPLAIILCVLFLGILPGFIEELVFRGAILQGLKRYGKWFAVIVSALLFMLMHGNVQQTIYQFGCGIIFGLLVWETGSLWASILIHCANNTLMVILQSLIDCGIIVSTPTEITWVYVVLSFVLVIALAFIVLLALKLIKKFNVQTNSSPNDETIISENSLDFKEFKKEKRAYNYLIYGVIISFAILVLNTIL